MKTLVKYFVAVLATAIFAGSLSANGWEWGSRSVRFTGTEELTMPPTDPGWASFGITQTISFPALNNVELVLYSETNDTQVIPGPEGSFYFGTADIYCGGYADPVAKVAYTLITGFVFEPPTTVVWWGRVMLVGSFWDGPLVGCTIHETVNTEGTIDVTLPYPDALTSYAGEVTGYITAPEKMIRNEWMAIIAD